MGKPVIGITGNLMIIEDGLFSGGYRNYVNHDYIKTVEKAGGIPLVFPVIDDKQDYKKVIDRVDGLLLSGGYDIAPVLYGEEPSASSGFSMEYVDQFYIDMIWCAYQKKIPILGICKGAQAINVAFGGTLYQDINEKEGIFKHMQSAPKGNPTHVVNFKPGSRLHRIMGDKARVNSFHHQAVKDIAEGFLATAWAGDGIVEAIEKDGAGYVIGVQWHPEMMTSSGNDTMLPLLKDYIQECEIRR